jgi:hypothetical protein
VIEIGADLNAVLDAVGVDRDGSLVLITEAEGALHPAGSRRARVDFPATLRG